MKLSGLNFIDLYIDWLKSNISFAEIGDYTEINTPFLDRHNDHMQIYVKQIGSRLLLTDDGYTISDLIMSGCDISSYRRRNVLETIINGVGVKIDNNDALYTDATIDNFAQKKHMLIQAMISVNDMFMLSQHRVASLFLEDVESYLLKNEIRFISSVQFNGKSNFSHTFDFVIPSSNQKPERLIKAINTPTKEKAQSMIFSWTDIKEVRKKETSMYVFLNDADKTVHSDVINAFGEYDVKTVLWSQKDRYVSELIS